MPGIAIGDATRFAVQNAIKEGDKLAGWRNLAQSIVEAPAQFLRFN